MRKKLKIENVILSIFFLIFLATFIYSSYKIIAWLVDSKNTKNQIDNVQNNVVVTEISDKDKEEIINESKEYHNKELESIMTGLFSEDELYLESLLKSRYKTKMLLDFINKVIEHYLHEKTKDKIEIRKRNILQHLYIEGMKQSEFIYNYYEVDRTFYTDKDKLIKDLAPYFFGIKGLNI